MEMIDARALKSCVPLLPGFTCTSGKVRDMINLSADELLVVATDRISAFDVVIEESPIPWKGRVLNSLSIFWNHIIQRKTDFLSARDEDCFARLERLGRLDAGTKNLLRGRMTLVRKAAVIPVECVVRGYLSGSGWKEYAENSRKGNATAVPVLGHNLPRGLVESDKLQSPIFTPTTKAQEGHDMPLVRHEDVVSYIKSWLEESGLRIGFSAEAIAVEIKRLAVAAYETACGYALTRRIIIADTKFEFGVIDGHIVFVDERLTPDSSRFWDADLYKPSGPQTSYDKQPVRDWLERSGWNKKPPAPALPEEVISATTSRYTLIHQLLTGWPVEAN